MDVHRVAMRPPMFQRSQPTNTAAQTNIRETGLIGLPFLEKGWWRPFCAEVTYSPLGFAPGRRFFKYVICPV